MNSPHADVAELADAQVSEACDGDIVEVQVLSSAPILELQKRALGSISYLGSLSALAFYFGTTARRARITDIARHAFTQLSVFNENQIRKV
jgi:hypothetical protein